MLNPKSCLLAVIPVDILLTKLGWKWFSPTCWSWLPRISTSCLHSSNASSLVAGLPLLCLVWTLGNAPSAAPGTHVLPCQRPWGLSLSLSLHCRDVCRALVPLRDLKTLPSKGLLTCVSLVPDERRGNPCYWGFWERKEVTSVHQGKLPFITIAGYV